MSRTPLPRPTRRSTVAGLLALGALPGGALASDHSPRRFAGTYDADGGHGLVALTAEGGGRWQAGTGFANIRNASFGVAAPRGGRRYLLDEQTQGGLGVYDTALRPLARTGTGGADPCHLALSPGGVLLAVANYSSGSVALWSLDPATGLPRAAAQLVQHRGSGPDRERQAGPHAHWVGFTRDGAILHAVDLGADAVFAHRIDPATGRIADTRIAYAAPAGAGPRHLARHPRLPVAYLVAELANTVTVLRAGSAGTFTHQATLSTLPAHVGRASAAAHIALNAAGTRLYVSNRGHDSIAVFAIDAAGALTPIQHVACGGHWPRFFRLEEARGEMLLANQRSGTIARLPLGRDGRLGTATQTLAVPGVAFIGA